jgi:hypothetical protein
VRAHVTAGTNPRPALGKHTPNCIQITSVPDSYLSESTTKAFFNTEFALRISKNVPPPKMFRSCRNQRSIHTMIWICWGGYCMIWTDITSKVGGDMISTEHWGHLRPALCMYVRVQLLWKYWWKEEILQEQTWIPR